jgi:hypothetical protein
MYRVVVGGADVFVSDKFYAAQEEAVRRFKQGRRVSLYCLSRKLRRWNTR